MNWEDLQKRYEEIVRTPASFTRETIEQLTRDLDQFATAHLGTEEAKQADKYQQELKDLLRKEPARNRDGDLSQAKVLIDGAPEDMRRGIELLESLLVHDSENDEIYELLTRAAKNSPSFETAIQEIIGRISPSRLGRFEKAIHPALEQPQNSPLPGGSNVPSPSSDDTLPLEELLKRAEDSYYSGEWVYTSELIQKILAKDPLNQWAKTHLEKVRINQTAVGLDARLPREAKQLFRRARSFIVAKQFTEASRLLNEAIGIAEKTGISFARAEELLDSMENVFIADEFKEKVKENIKQGNLVEALNNLEKAMLLLPDPEKEPLILLQKQLNGLVEIERKIKGLVSNELEAMQFNRESKPFEEIREMFGEFAKSNQEINTWIKEAEIQKNLSDKFAGECEKAAIELEKNGRSFSSEAKGANHLSAAIELSESAKKYYERASKINGEKTNLKNEIGSLVELLKNFTDLQKLLDVIDKWDTGNYQLDKKVDEKLCQLFNYINYYQVKQSIKKLLDLQTRKTREKWMGMGSFQKLSFGNVEELKSGLSSIISISTKFDFGQDFAPYFKEIEDLSKEMGQYTIRLNQIRSQIMLFLSTVMLFACAFSFYSYAGRTFGPAILPWIFPSHTPSPIPTATFTPTPNPSLTPMPTNTLTPVFTPSMTSSPTNTPTLTPIPTPAQLVYIVALINACPEPGATECIGAVPQGTIATVLKTQVVGSTVWYLIQWQNGDTIGQGWITDTYAKPFKVTPNS